MSMEFFTPFGSATEPVAFSIEQWARFALTGDADADAPTDEQLAISKASVIAQIVSAAPCIGPDPLTDLQGADREAFTEWAGYLLAARFVNTPEGREVFEGITELRVGPVTEKSGGAVSMDDAKAGWQAASLAARARISCILQETLAAGLAAGAGFGLAGRRRALGCAPVLRGRRV